MRISFSFGQRSFPVIDSLSDTMMYRKGSLPYPSEYHPCHLQRRILSPGMSPSGRSMATDCFLRKHSLQNVGILDPLCKPSSKETVNDMIGRTSEPPLYTGKSSPFPGHVDLPIPISNEVMYKHWSDGRLLDSGIFVSASENVTNFDIPIDNSSNSNTIQN